VVAFLIAGLAIACGALVVGAFLIRRHSLLHGDVVSAEPTDAPPYFARAPGPVRSARLPRLVVSSSQPAIGSPESNSAHPHLFQRPDRKQLLKEEIATVMTRLERSGPADGNWTSNAFDTFDGWRRKLSTFVQVDFADFRCYKVGCTIAATFPDLANYQKAVRELARGQEAGKGWSGGTFRSGPDILETNAVKMILVLYHTDS